MRFDVFFAENTDKEVTEKEVKKLLASKNPEFAYMSAFIGRDNYKQFKDLYEAKILESPYWTFKYVADVLNHIRGDTSKPHNRWPKGESVIATDAYASWLYARYIIYGRWPMGEKAIFDSEDPQYKDLYLDFLKNIGYQDEDNEEQQDDVITRDLITNRFQGKEIVSLDDSIDYAAERNKRWPKLEQYILYLHFPHYGAVYAKKVIKGRWVEYENYLKKYYSVSSHYMEDYLEMLKELGYEDEDNEEQDNIIRRALFTYVDNFTGKIEIDDTTSLKYAIRQGKRWPRLEQYILNSYLGVNGIEYAEKVIQGRWLEYEDFLNKHWKERMPEYVQMLNRIGYEDEDNEELSFEAFYDNFIPKTPNDVFELAKDLGERLPEYEHIIINSNDPNAPTIAYEYLKKIINKDVQADYNRVTWPEAEPLLAKDYDVAFRYALYYINADKWDDEAYNDLPLTRFPLGEPEIAKNAYTAARYATNILKGRWPMGEEAIFKDNYEKKEYIKFLNDIGYEDEDNEELSFESFFTEAKSKVILQPSRPPTPQELTKPHRAYMYARKILKGRWPEMEPLIAKDVHAAYSYAKFVIKGEFPLGEPTIAKDGFISSLYARIITKRRFPLGEPTIAKNDSAAYWYAVEVLKGRFLEGEPAILNSILKNNYIEFLNDIGYEDEDNEELSFESFFTESKVRPPTEKELTDPAAAYFYARDVIKGRWPEGEKAILDDPSLSWTINYIVDILKSRWPEAEPAIFSDPEIEDMYMQFLNDIGYQDEDNEELSFESFFTEAKSKVNIPPTSQELTDPKSAYEYARKILKDKFPEGEEAMAKSPIYSYNYARNVLNDKFPLGEKAISRSPKYSYDYAKNVLKDKFPLGEKAIMRDNVYFINYINDVIKGRWLDAEPIIAKQPVNAVLYAIYILKNRWPEAEPYIAKQPGPAVHYARYVLKNRWPEAETSIAKNDYWGYEYTTQVVKDRWPEYEKYLKDDRTKNDYIEYLNKIGYEDED